MLGLRNKIVGDNIIKPSFTISTPLMYCRGMVVFYHNCKKSSLNFSQLVAHCMINAV